MSFISNNPPEAIIQFMELIDSKNIKYQQVNGEKKFIKFFGGDLILENYNQGRSKKGLLTTNDNLNNKIRLNEIFCWKDKFGNSKKRYQYNILGKNKSEIELIIDIAQNIKNLNKLIYSYNSIHLHP
jgi:hypothetical protein